MTVGNGAAVGTDDTAGILVSADNTGIVTGRDVSVAVLTDNTAHVVLFTALGNLYRTGVDAADDLNRDSGASAEITRNTAGTLRTIGGGVSNRTSVGAVADRSAFRS